jgi:ribosomal protein S27AE
MDILSVQQRCPKCGGNLFLYNDYQGWYEQCLQCSFTLYLNAVYKNTRKVEPNRTTEVGQSMPSRA